MCAAFAALVAFAAPVAAQLVTEGRNPAMADPAIDATGPFCYLSRPTAQLAVAAANRGSQLTYDGAVHTGSAELCFFTGSPLRPIMVRQKQLRDGWLPFVTYGWSDGAAAYQIEAFAATLDGDPLTTGVDFVRVTATNRSSKTIKTHFAAAIRFSGLARRFQGLKPFPFSPDWRYEMTSDTLVRDGRVVVFFPPTDVKEAVPGVPYTAPFVGRDLFVSERAETGLVSYAPILAPKQQVSWVFKLPMVPIPPAQKEIVDQVRAADFDEMSSRTEMAWHKAFATNTKLSLPERKVMDAHRASLMYAMQAIWQANGKMIQGVNKFQYRGFWLRDGAYILHAYDLWGFPRLVEKLLEVYPKYQQPDGLFSSYEGQFDGFGQALWTFGKHALLTGDVAFARSVYKFFPPAMDWLAKARQGDPFHIMPKTTVGDNEFIQGHYTGHNFWALLGARTAVRVARMTGNTADADKWLKQYNDYRDTFLRKLDDVTSHDGYIPPGLDAKGGQDWGNLIGIYPAEVLEPTDTRVAATLRKVRTDKYAEGMMTYMGRLHQYLTVKATQNFVARNEQEEALRDFYAILLHMGSTQEMFEWRAEPWGDRDVETNFPPHGWGAAMFNILLRQMMVREVGGDGGLGQRDLMLFSVISPEWAKPGCEIRIENAPTELGPISATLKFTKDGANLSFDPKFRTQPGRILFPTPYFVAMKDVKSDFGQPGQEGGVFSFPPTMRHVSFKWDRKKVAPMSFDSAVAAYKTEYARRFAKYRAAGNRPMSIDAPRLLDAAERKALFTAAYATPVANLALNKPIRSSVASDPKHGPEFAVDGITTSGHQVSAWWAKDKGKTQLEVDLGETTSVAAIHVFPAFWDGVYHQYTVEVSRDGKTWKEVADMSRNTESATNLGDYHPLPSGSKVRFVRLNAQYNSADNIQRIVEIKVYPPGF